MTGFDSPHGAGRSSAAAIIGYLFEDLPTFLEDSAKDSAKDYDYL